MNLSDNPTKEQLKALIAHVDDNEGHHILWVNRDGDVNLTLLREDLTPVRFDQTNGAKMKFRLEVLAAGMGYTGPGAAEDEKWMTQVWNRLNSLWSQNYEGYSDAPDDV